MKSITSLVLVTAAIAATIACSSGPSGTYSDALGACVLELKSGHKANFTFGGDVEECTYSTSGKHVSLTCKDVPGGAGPTVFTIHDDGSLTGPPGAFMPTLRKQK
jgi:hypothetical protein